MSNVSKEVKVTVIVTRDEMAYMVQRVVANMEEIISVPVTVTVEKAESEADITSVLASRIYDSITESYKVASVLVATEKCESITGVNSDGNLVTITKEKNGNQSFETSITNSL